MDEAPGMAQTTRAGGVHRAGYDSILPSEVREELLRRGRRPVVKTPRAFPTRAFPRQWQSILTFFGMVGTPLLAIAALGGVMIAIQTIGRNAAPPTQANVPTPPAAATPSHSSQPKPNYAPSVTVRRADPVPITVKRAELVRFPELRTGLTELSPEHIDEMHGITMPYGERVNATLRGFLEQENQLPRVGRVGDMYVVAGVPWIWTTAPGAVSPQWVDP
jgi:hypothetical protein